MQIVPATLLLHLPTNLIRFFVAVAVVAVVCHGRDEVPECELRVYPSVHTYLHAN